MLFGVEKGAGEVVCGVLLHIMLHIKFRRSRIVCLIRKQMKIKTICRHEIVYKNGKSPLAIRFTHQRTHKTVSLGISVEPHYWDKDAEMITANCPERVILQSKNRQYISDL